MKKTFKNLDELVEYLENQMIMVKVLELHQQQLDYIDQAVLQSDMKESKEVLKYIMEK